LAAKRDAGFGHTGLAAAARLQKASPEPPYTQPGGSGADIPEMSAPEYIAAKQLVKCLDVGLRCRASATWWFASRSAKPRQSAGDLVQLLEGQPESTAATDAQARPSRLVAIRRAPEVALVKEAR
jgi:hypothetical protein